MAATTMLKAISNSVNVCKTCMSDGIGDKQWVLHLLIQLHVQVLLAKTTDCHVLMHCPSTASSCLQEAAMPKSRLLALLTRLDNIDKFWF